MSARAKQLLKTRNRSYRKYPGMQSLGPTGARLWADCLECAPGFSGSLDFIHKLNLPLLFSVRVSGREARLSPALHTWYPDESLLEYSDERLRFTERKTIAWDDVACSLQSWENTGVEPLVLELVLPEGAALDKAYLFPVNLHGFRVIMRLSVDDAFNKGSCVLMPGEQRRFLLAAALGLEGEDDVLLERLSNLDAQRSEPDAFLDGLSSKYLRWFDDAPSFECSDPYIERCWWYRMYLLRSCLAKPGFGYLKHALFYEGRSLRMAKTPYRKSGWEFSRLIPLSTPLTMTDMRWMNQPAVSNEAFRALTDSVNADGAFSVSAVDGSGKEYTNYASWALYQYYLLNQDLSFIREVLPAYKKDCDSVFERHKSANDSLMVCYTHQLTGKEYQPGFWFFTNQCFPAKVRGTQEGYTPLKRVDASIYMYLNCLGLAHLCRETGDPDAEKFEQRANAIRRDVLDKMWDSSSGCFYDLHYQNGRRAYVKHIVSVYPLWAGITSAEHLKLFDYLFSPDYFARGSGFASTAADCPVYSPNGGWKGDYFKGRDGCMWNGPSWPYTTGIALDAAARQSKAHGHQFDESFMQVFRQYTLEHFRMGDLNSPCLVEFYDAETGETLSDEADYNHSFYLDLVIRHLCGLEPTAEGFCFHPLRSGLDRFLLQKVRIRGHRIDVHFHRKAEDGFQAGYTLLIDGEKKLAESCEACYEHPLSFALSQKC